jgi:hypothetical protein
MAINTHNTYHVMGYGTRTSIATIWNKKSVQFSVWFRGKTASEVHLDQLLEQILCLIHLTCMRDRCGWITCRKVQTDRI